ncbi:unnamed protein product [Penicillium salamii]|uniref:FAD-binding PCMH-type domain-containing protein n=1 Tax=Penicillium salamii TaxID=1612424 RepID=A0A9W4JK40_9EURO|nr:unnamed protein product [Penicillium salamii]CAG8154680.1 unnamed protein product [Penicillium salamii]CAG8223755.1 unnamed protein product [Penicillium salamii]CAG8318185.1 unnamed protein product [Penicillium salamii]CAG8330673.1 unnamed protein product [Penicillium salamii]
MLVYKMFYIILLAFHAAASSHNSDSTAQSPSTTACVNACADLRDEFSSRLHHPGNGNFTVWDGKQQEVQSACRVEPSTAEDVSKILATLVYHWCPFAVKSGGHAQNADDSVSVGDVTIDLNLINHIEVAQDQQTVDVGSGSTIFDIYHSLEVFKLSAIGARVADVGIGGFALGGGISNLAPKYGLAVDNILQYEVCVETTGADNCVPRPLYFAYQIQQIVLPNATIVCVNETQHPDLYFALRGGMNNFGIVTRFTMHTFHQPKGPISQTDKIFSLTQKNAVTDEAFQLTTAWKNDTDMAFYYFFSYNSIADHFVLAFSEIYTQPILEPAPFAGLRQIPYESKTAQIERMSTLSLEAASRTPSGNRNLFATVAYYPSARMDRHIMEIIEEEIEPVKKMAGFLSNVMFQPLFKNAVRAGRERGGSALGIEAKGPLTGGRHSW